MKSRVLSTNVTKIFVLLSILWLCYSDANAQWAGSTTIDGTTYRNGMTGIGLSAPSSIFHVYRPSPGDGHSVFLSEYGSDGGRWSKVWLNKKDSWDGWYPIYVTSNMLTSPLFVVKVDGKVGIGTSNPQYPLSVNGTIQAKEVIVNSAWSDFVFEDGYKLPSLEKVNEFIEKNGHLEGIPSAQEVDSNGISVGQIESKLLQKIEELTLYLIEQDKKINEVQKENSILKEKIEKLIKN